MTFVDLGMSPLANSYIAPEAARQMEPFYPLHAYVCERCFLVQLEEFESPQAIFSEYAYFSSYSSTWLEHARGYAGAMIERFGLGGDSLVCEVASNDGYLLRWFADREIPVLGVEPAANVAEVAVAAGIPTEVEFFGHRAAVELAKRRRADLIAANNVLAHVPDINDFVEGFRVLLAPTGTITVEFPHLMRLVEERQFDTIYHEHFSYLSFLTVSEIFAAHGLTVWDVDELPTHGGSLRIYAGHVGGAPEPTERALEMRARENEAGYRHLALYREFAENVKAAKRDLLDVFIQWKRQGLSIAGYGAAAKGNTLLNFCGIGTDFIDFVVDRSPHKQGRLLPGTRIPIRSPAAVREAEPDILFILPWNIREEVMQQMAFIREWGGRFAVSVPSLEVL